MQMNEQDTKMALTIMKSFVIFAENQEAEGHVDGACDPDISVTSAKKLLNKHDPDWDKSVQALEA